MIVLIEPLLSKSLIVKYTNFVLSLFWHGTVDDFWIIQIYVADMTRKSNLLWATKLIQIVNAFSEKSINQPSKLYMGLYNPCDTHTHTHTSTPSTKIETNLHKCQAFPVSNQFVNPEKQPASGAICHNRFSDGPSHVPISISTLASVLSIVRRGVSALFLSPFII